VRTKKCKTPFVKNYKIAILGLGWLGIPLAKYFAEKGAFVSGSTTSTQKLAELLSQPFAVRK
jgi:UDP-N-acetyl-D-mannosaminuronate dehydrogenase